MYKGSKFGTNNYKREPLPLAVRICAILLCARLITIGIIMTFQQKQHKYFNFNDKFTL